MKTYICLRNIDVAFASRGGTTRHILSDLNFELCSGERVALVGQNGSGKTTFLRLLLGAIHPTSGTIERSANSRTNQIAYVPQDYRNALFPWLSLKTNLLIHKRATNSFSAWSHLTSGEALESALAEYLPIAEAFRLAVNLRDKPPSLSSGQQQLFLLAKALMGQPDLLVLDEPLSAIDFGRKRSIRSFLSSKMAGLGTTLVFASHNFDESVLLADKVLVLGRLGGIIDTIPVTLPWPRTIAMEQTQEFAYLVNRIAELLE